MVLAIGKYRAGQVQNGINKRNNLKNKKNFFGLKFQLALVLWAYHCIEDPVFISPVRISIIDFKIKYNACNQQQYESNKMIDEFLLKS